MGYWICLNCGCENNLPTKVCKCGMTREQNREEAIKKISESDRKEYEKLQRKKIAKEMKKNGATLQKIAEHLGVTKQTISNWLN